MKAYIVTAYSYSDYHIEAVFADERQAYAYCEKRNGAIKDDALEPWELLNVEAYDISETESELTRMGVYALFSRDSVKEFGLSAARFTSLGFKKTLFGDIIGNGDIELFKGEPIEQFRERAKRIIIDKYADWKKR